MAMKMMNNDFEGIVIRVSDYQENDCILNVLSNEGKKTFKARGIKKVSSKNAICTQLFSLATFHLVEGKRLLKQAELIHSFRKIREDLLKQGIAQLMCEMIDKSDAHSKFNCQLFSRYLYALEESEQPYCVLTLFLSESMQEQGIELNVDSCCCCSSQNGIMALSLEDGGFICSNCFNEVKHKQFSSQQLRLLRYAFKADITQISKLEEFDGWDYQLIQFLLCFITSYSGIYLKSAAFLEWIEAVN